MRTFATESGKRMIRRLAILLCLSLVIGLIPNALLSAPVTANAAELNVVTNPQAGVSYKAGIAQNIAGKTLYITGNTADVDYRLETTEDPSKAVDVKLEAGNGGFYMYFMKGSTKTYIEIYEWQANKGSLKLTTSKPASVMTYNSAAKTFFTTIGKNTYYLGTYASWETISASGTYYITGDNASKVDVEQFPLRMYATGGNQGGNSGATQPTVATQPTTPAIELEMVTDPKANTAYKIGLVQKNLGSKTLYFTGNMVQDKFLETTEDPSKAVDVKLEAAGSGFYMYFMKGSVKTYINYAEYDKGNGKFGCRLSLTADAPAIAMTYNSDWNTMVVDCDEDSYTLGTYQTFNTISASSIYYITGDKAGEIGVSQFLMHFYAEPAQDPEPTTATQPAATQPAATQPAATQPAATQPAATQPAATQPAATQPAATQPAATEPAATEPETEIQLVTKPEADAPYIAGMAQSNLGKTLYFTGNTADVDYRLETTDDPSKAVELKLEAANSGYYLYFVKDGVKTYIEIYEYTKEGDKYPKGSLKLTTEKPASVLTYSEEWNTLVAVFGENSYYMGTYNTFNTVSVSSTYYISGDKAADVDKTQFPLRLYAEQVVGGNDGNTGTGDNTMIVTASTVMVLALAAVVVVLFKKRKFF